MFNKDAKGTKFLEQIQDFTDEDFQDLLDNAVDETGRLDGLYNLYDEIELFELMRNNFDGIEDTYYKLDFIYRDSNTNTNVYYNLLRNFEYTVKVVMILSRTME